MTNHRSGAVTFKGNPLTLVGDELVPGAKAPDFDLHCYGADGMQQVKRDDFSGKPLIVSVVPSLDTPVCQVQTRTFNEQISALGDQINAVTVSLDLPFAQGRFCDGEGITSMQNLSDYKDRSFGTNWGMLIDELKLLARGVFVLDSEGTVIHAEVVGEVVDEPNYETALAAIQGLL